MFLAVLAAALVVWVLLPSNRQLPPGPRAYPLLGNLLSTKHIFSAFLRVELILVCQACQTENASGKNFEHGANAGVRYNSNIGILCKLLFTQIALSRKPHVRYGVRQTLRLHSLVRVGFRDF